MQLVDDYKLWWENNFCVWLFALQTTNNKQQTANSEVDDNQIGCSVVHKLKFFN